MKKLFLIAMLCLTVKMSSIAQNQLVSKKTTVLFFYNNLTVDKDFILTCNNIYNKVDIINQTKDYQFLLDKNDDNKYTITIGNYELAVKTQILQLVIEFNSNGIVASVYGLENKNCSRKELIRIIKTVKKSVG